MLSLGLGTAFDGLSRDPSGISVFSGKDNEAGMVFFARVRSR